VEISVYERRMMIFKKDQLLVPEKLLERRLAFLRAEYDRTAAPVAGKAP